MNKDELRMCLIIQELIRLVGSTAKPDVLASKMSNIRYIFRPELDTTHYSIGQGMRMALRRYILRYDGPTKIFGTVLNPSDIRIAFLELLGVDREYEDADPRRLRVINRLGWQHPKLPNPTPEQKVDYWRRYGPENEFIELLAENMYWKCQELLFKEQTESRTPAAAPETQPNLSRS